MKDAKLCALFTGKKLGKAQRGLHDFAIFNSFCTFVSLGICCSYFTICRSQRSWKSSDKKWILADYSGKLVGWG